MNTQRILDALNEIDQLTDEIRAEVTPVEPVPPPLPDPEPTPGDVVTFQPDANNEIVIRGLRPGQTGLLQVPSGKLSKLSIDNVHGTAAQPITLKTEFPFALTNRHTEWANLSYIVFDMRVNAQPGFEFTDRFFVRYPAHNLTFRGFTSHCSRSVSWTIKPRESNQTMSHITIDSCHWANVPLGEGIYIGNDQANPSAGDYLMTYVTVKNCTFAKCGEPLHLLGVVGFNVELNTMVDTLTTNPPSHNAGVSIGRNSTDGIIKSNFISNVRGNGINVLSGNGPLTIEGNVIDRAGTGAGDADLKKNIFGIRLQTGNADRMAIRGNTIKNIDTAGIDLGGHLKVDDRAAYTRQLEAANTFTNCRERVSG